MHLADLLLDPLTLTALLSFLIVLAAVFSYRRLANSSGPRSSGKLLERLLIPLAIMQFGVLLFSATPAVVNRLLYYTENLVTVDSACVEELSPLVVLSGGVSSAVRSAEDLGAAYQATFVRMAEATALIRRQSGADYDIFLVGGSMRRGIAEADVMKHYFELTGVEPERLLTERQSSNTAESAAELSRMLKSVSISEDSLVPATEIRLLTSALHMARARAVFVSQGFQVCPVPVGRQAIANVPWWYLLPQLSVVEKFDALMHEWIGVLYYKFRGYI